MLLFRIFWFLMGEQFCLPSVFKKNSFIFSYLLFCRRWICSLGDEFYCWWWHLIWQRLTFLLTYLLLHDWPVLWPASQVANLNLTGCLVWHVWVTQWVSYFRNNWFVLLKKQTCAHLCVLKHTPVCNMIMLPFYWTDETYLPIEFCLWVFCIVCLEVIYAFNICYEGVKDNWLSS